MATCLCNFDGKGVSKMMENRNFTRKVLAFLCLLIFTLSVPAQEPVVPIVYGETLIGGAQNGKWITAEKTDAQLKDKTEFKILSFNGFKKGSIFGTKDDDRGVCTENPRLTFEEPEANINDAPPFAIGANAKWNPVPRLPQAIGLKDKTYTKIVADFLKTKGIAKTKIKITQAFRIDLEGDGKDEIIITGNYYKKGGGETQNAGDYSFILLRRTLKGKPQNVLIEGDFFTAKLLRSGEFDPPNIHKITAIADLNGDGKMEIVLADFGYEAHSYTILEMKNGKPVKVLESECSV